jgi:hypothetical protein
MIKRLKEFSDGMGPNIQKLLEDEAGEPVAFICLAFPIPRTMEDSPQPLFLTNMPTELCESVMRQIGSQMTPEFCESRVVVEDNG